jgi:Na+-translocating ferredoxin:NAD+ oxidoreductase subunit D
MLSKILVTHSPHISKPMSTRSVMLDVIIALVPAMCAAAYFFRGRAVVLLAACVVSAVVTEWLCNVIRKRSHPFESVTDCSAVLTAIILALSLPPHLPAWAAVIGTVFAIAIGKMVYGGLGANVFNPAMVGRTFLALSFGQLMTTFTVPATVDKAMSVISPTQVEARTQATPLGWSKEAIKARAKAALYADEEDEVAAEKSIALSKKAATAVNDQLGSAVMGAVGGCLGETSALMLALGGVYLLIRKAINFHIPLAVLSAALLFAGVTYYVNPQSSMTPWGHLCNGGLLMCAFFIATDPVTAPLTRRGMWIFGLGIGFVVMLIRIVGAYPEGVMFAVLLMNSVTPLIDRLCKRVPAGGALPHE